MSTLKLLLLLFVLFWLLPLGVAAMRYAASEDGTSWRVADRSSAGLLPPASAHDAAVVRIFAARTVRWRGIFATHCWIVFKPEGARAYTRYDYTAWGEPIRMDGFAPDGRWFGRVPDVAFAADGARAAALIPRMQAAIRGYAWHAEGDYRAWPGPNSNSFVSAVMEAVPEAGAVLPNTAIGKAYPYDGRWLRRTATGFRLTLGGYGGLALGWREGLEIDILGAAVGLDWRRPAVSLPGLGRYGLPAMEAEPAAATVTAAG